MSASRPLVTMKGRKDGLVLVMDETCSYDELLRELKDKLSASQHVNKEDPVISVKVQAGNRYITTEQKSELSAVIRSFDHLQVDEIETNVMTREEFEKQRLRERIVPAVRVIRSGQVLSVEGDLLLIGDVNPGGMVSATGNIYILGSLRGIASAATAGDGKNAVIVASHMAPAQLRIGNLVRRIEGSTEAEKREENVPEYAYIDLSHERIAVDRLHDALSRHRISLPFAEV